MREISLFATNMEQAGDLIEGNPGDENKSSSEGLCSRRKVSAELLAMIDCVAANLRTAASLFVTADERAARLLVGEKEVFRSLETAATDAHFDRLRAGRLDTAETSNFFIFDALRDLKSVVNTHLVAAGGISRARTDRRIALEAVFVRAIRN